MSNIAEGFERTHLQEKIQFYNIARGSAGEVRSLLYVISDNFPEAEAEALAPARRCKDGRETGYRPAKFDCEAPKYRFAG